MTPAPSRSTRPHISWPKVRSCGLGPELSFISPRQMGRSEPQTPARVSLTRMAPGSTSGTGYSRSANSPPYARSTATRPFIRPPRRTAAELSQEISSPRQDLGVGAWGAGDCDTGAPQLAQWVHAASIALLQEPHNLGGAGLSEAPDCVLDACSSSASVPNPFLNSFMDLPSDLARSGSLLPPNSTSTMTRMIINSWAPRPNMAVYLLGFNSMAGAPRIRGRAGETAPGDRRARPRSRPPPPA